MAEEEQKIIIDEGWKAQVQKEKAQASVEKAEQPKAIVDDDLDGEEAPEANFIALVSSLATQCMFALGLIAARDARQVMVDIAGAKFIIDLLLVLRDKTKGNLSNEENAAMTETISELQRAFVVRAQQMQEATLKEAGIDINSLRNPEAPPAF